MDSVKCSQCGRTHKNNRWAKTKAHQSGWFEQKDGTVYCPDHTPDWVTAWRARKTNSTKD